MAEDRLDFKQMCERFEVTPRTLRHYEYVELLSPEREGRGRYLRRAGNCAHDTDLARPPLWLFAWKKSANGWNCTTPTPNNESAAQGLGGIR